MSRTDDTFVSLEDRSEMANNIEDLDLFVSIHHNASSNTEVNRGEVIYSVKENESQRLAECIENKLYDVGNTEVKIYNRYNSKGTDYYAVIRNTDITSIIVEVSFITSEDGVSLVDTPEERERNGILIAQGIMDYLGVDYSNDANATEIKNNEAEQTVNKNSGLDIIMNILNKKKENKGYQILMEALNK